MGHPRASPPRAETDRQRAIAACAAHLRDLRRAHGHAPPDVAVPQRGGPARLSARAPASYCVSPGQLCAELAK